MWVLTMLKNSENNGREEIVTPTPGLSVDTNVVSTAGDPLLLCVISMAQCKDVVSPLPLS